MSFLSFILLFLAITSSLIWAIVLALRLPRDERLSLWEDVFLAVLIFLFQAILVGIGLGAFGLYRIPNILVAYTLLVTIGGAILWWKSGAFPVLDEFSETKNLLPLILLFLACWLFSYTGDTAAIWRDDGAYLRAGISLAKSGDILAHITNISDIPNDLKPVLELKNLLRGMYRITPDNDIFAYHGLAGIYAPYALGYLLFNLKGIFLFRVLIGLGAVLSLFSFTKRAFNSFNVAILSSILFTLSMPLIWSVRMGLTEPMSQTLLMGGMWLLWIAHKNNLRSWALASSLLISIALIIHLSNWVIVVPLALYVFYLVIADNVEQKKWITSSFLPSFILFAACAYAYNITFSAGYIKAVGNSLNPIRYSILLLFVIFCIGVVVKRFFPQVVNIIKANKELIGNYMPWIISITFFLLALYGYLIRPYLSSDLWIGGESQNSRYAFQWFVWYITPLGVFGGISGFFLWLRREMERFDSIWVPFVLTALIFIVGMGTTAKIVPIHFWLSRRYVPMMLPFFLIFFSFFVLEIRKFRYRLSREIAAAIFLFVLISEIYILSPNAFKREFYGRSIPLEELQSIMPSNASLITFSPDQGGWDMDGYLRTILGDRIYPVNQDSADIEKVRNLVQWLCARNKVYILSTFHSIGSMFSPSEIEYVKVFNLEYSFSAQVGDCLPRKWHHGKLSVILWRIFDPNRDGIRNVKTSTVFKPGNKPFSEFVEGIYGDGWIHQKSFFALSRIKVVGPVYLSLSLSRPNWEGLPPATIRVYLNKCQLTDFEVKPGTATYKVEIPVDIINMWRMKDNLVSLEVLGGFFVPKDMGLSNDKRSLAVRLKEIRLKSQSQVAS